MKFNRLMLGILAIVAIGCGGGGGGSAVPGGGGNTTLSLFASDSLSTDYDHVWVKVHRVSVGDRQVFNSATGKVLDLKTLRDATGARFAFLDDSSLPAGSYDDVKVDLDKDLTLVPVGTTIGQIRQFSDAYDLVGTPGMSQLKIAGRNTFGAGRQSLVVDFDLANWNLDGAGRVVALVKRGDDTGIDDRRRHEDEDHGGSVSGLSGTAPNQTFTLSRTGVSLAVRTDASTRIYNESGLANPLLGNGKRVEVTGAFVAGVLLAASVKIEDEAGEDPHGIKGPITSANVGAGTFEVTVTRARGFVPDRSSYQIATTGATRYLSDAGVPMTKADFFAAATVGTELEAEGTVSGGTLTAVKVKLENEQNEAEIKGSVTSVNTGASELTISAQSWFGVSLSAGASVRLTTTAATTYRLGNATVTKAQFFAGMSVGRIVEAKGSYSNGVLSSIRLKDDD